MEESSKINMSELLNYKIELDPSREDRVLSFDTDDGSKYKVTFPAADWELVYDTDHGSIYDTIRRAIPDYMGIKYDSMAVMEPESTHAIPHFFPHTKYTLEYSADEHDIVEIIDRARGWFGRCFSFGNVEKIVSDIVHHRSFFINSEDAATFQDCLTWMSKQFPGEVFTVGLREVFTFDSSSPSLNHPIYRIINGTFYEVKEDK